VSRRNGVYYMWKKNFHGLSKDFTNALEYNSLLLLGVVLVLFPPLIWVGQKLLRKFRD
jgi:hypothetical protein